MSCLSKFPTTTRSSTGPFSWSDGQRRHRDRTPQRPRRRSATTADYVLAQELATPIECQVVIGGLAFCGPNIWKPRVRPRPIWRHAYAGTCTGPPQEVPDPHGLTRGVFGTRMSAHQLLSDAQRVAHRSAPTANKLWLPLFSSPLPNHNAAVICQPDCSPLSENRQLLPVVG